MTENPQPDIEPEKLKRNTRIIVGRHFAEIFIEDSVAGPVFHWTVSLLDGSMLIALGEQSTYDIACQEAQHHLMLLAEADKSEGGCALGA